MANFAQWSGFFPLSQAVVTCNDRGRRGREGERPSSGGKKGVGWARPNIAREEGEGKGKGLAHMGKFWPDPVRFEIFLKLIF